MYNKNAKCSILKLEQPESDMVIYCLIDPRDDTPKYIGLTTSGFDRIRSHYHSERKENTLKINWIKKYRDDGFKLLNHTDGGDNVYRLTFSDEERKHMSIKHKEICNKPEVKERMRNAHLGLPSSNKGKKYSKKQLEFLTKRNQETSGKKIIDQNGNIYPSIQSLSKLLNSSMNTIKDRLYVNPDKPLKGLLLRLYNAK